MRTFLCFFFAFFFQKAVGQDYKAIDLHAQRVPESITHSIKSLSDYLCGPPARSDEDRLRAIYAWVTQNIAYQDSTNGAELWATPADIRRQRPEIVLRNRSAVCVGYSNLFQALADANDIPCEIISGIVRDPDGEIPRIGHAWVAAKVGRTWYLFDPTWGIPRKPEDRGYTDERYFMAAPEAFALDHLPDDPMWQFLENPIHENQFRTSSDATLRAVIAQPADTPFRYKDTLAASLRLDSVSRIHHAVYRILQFNAGSERVIFQLGRTFYKDFFELKFILDSIAIAHIFKLEERIDTVRFLRQVALLEQYHRRASDLFAQLRSPDRIERAGNLFAPAQMAAIIAKLRGDMYMALFQNALRQEPKITTEKQLKNLQLHATRVLNWHNTALSAFTTDSLFGDDRRDIWNLHSIIFWQLGNRYLHLVQNHINDETWQRKHPGVLTRSIATGTTLLGYADSCAQRLFLRPWYALAMRERLVSVRKSRITAVVLGIRLLVQPWTARIDALTKQPEFGEKDVRPIVVMANEMQKEIAVALDSLQHPQLPYDEIFVKTMSVNLFSDLYETQLRTGDLYYRLALFTYNKAIKGRKLSDNKAAILENINTAVESFNRANRSLTDMEKTGKALPATIVTGRRQVSELKKAVGAIRDSLR